MAQNVSDGCPQCRRLVAGKGNRLVTDACGHIKCRHCLLSEEDGCWSCKGPVETPAAAPPRLAAVQPLWTCEPGGWPTAGGGAPELRNSWLGEPAAVSAVRPSPLPGRPTSPPELPARGTQRPDGQTGQPAAGAGTGPGGGGPLPVWSSPPTPTEPTAADGGPAASARDRRRAAGPVPVLLQSSARIQQLRIQLTGGGAEPAAVPLEPVQPEDLSPHCAADGRPPVRHWVERSRRSAVGGAAPQQLQAAAAARLEGELERAVPRQGYDTQAGGDAALTGKTRQDAASEGPANGSSLRSLLMAEPSGEPRKIDHVKSRPLTAMSQPANLPKVYEASPKTSKRPLPIECSASGNKRAKRGVASDNETSLKRAATDPSPLKPQSVDAPADAVGADAETADCEDSTVEPVSALTDTPAPAAAAAAADGRCSSERPVSSDEPPTAGASPAAPAAGDVSPLPAPQPRSMKARILAQVHQENNRDVVEEEGREPAAEQEKSGTESDPKVSERSSDRTSGRRRGGSSNSKRVTANMVVRKVETGDNAKSEYECRECLKRFNTFSHWKYHISCRTGKARYRCSQCSWTGNVKQHYNYHMDRHKGVPPSHVCKVCSAKFLQKSTLDRHMATHNTEGGLQCAQCHTRFTCQYNYQRHLRTHTGEKPFVCRLCQRAFSDQGNLKKHMLKHTAGAEERCPVCPEPRLYRTPATLAQHLRECHDLPRPAQRHSCPAPACGKHFSRRSDLRRHQRIHTEAKEFSCPFCRVTSRRVDTLARHMAASHGLSRDEARQRIRRSAESTEPDQRPDSPTPLPETEVPTPASVALATASGGTSAAVAGVVSPAAAAAASEAVSLTTSGVSLEFSAAASVTVSMTAASASGSLTMAARRSVSSQQPLQPAAETAAVQPVVVAAAEFQPPVSSQQQQQRLLLLTEQPGSPARRDSVLKFCQSPPADERHEEPSAGELAEPRLVELQPVRLGDGAPPVASQLIHRYPADWPPPPPPTPPLPPPAETHRLYPAPSELESLGQAESCHRPPPPPPLPAQLPPRTSAQQLTQYQNHLRQMIGDAAFEGLSTMFDNLRNNVVACMSARHQDQDGRASRPS